VEPSDDVRVIAGRTGVHTKPVIPSRAEFRSGHRSRLRHTAVMPRERCFCT
jgi:hypothetical protein